MQTKTSEKNYSSPWELLPTLGLGQVAFRMSRSQVSAFDDVLGHVTSEHNPADLKDHVLDTYNLLKDFITEAEMKTVIEALEATNANDQRGVILSQHRMANGLTLEFEDGQLTEIFADNRAKQLHFKQALVFLCKPLTLIRKLAAELNENPIVQDDEVVFPQHNIYLFSFLRKDLTEGDPKNRTVMWREKPRVLGTDLATYTILNIQ